MRRIQASGGLELGVPDTGPWIDVIPLRPDRPVSLEEAAEKAQYATWLRWSRELMRRMEVPHVALSRLPGVVGTTNALEDGSQVAIRFLWRVGQSPFEALREIETAENGLPPAVAGAVLAAAQARNYPVYPEFAGAFAVVCGLVPQGPPSSFSRREIERLGDQYIARLSDPLAATLDANIPSGAADRARFWLSLSRRLWRSETLQTLAKTLDPVMHELQALMISALAGAWLGLKADKISIGGVSLTLPAEPPLATCSLAWRQMIAWTKDEISAEGVRFLFPGSFDVVDPFFLLKEADPKTLPDPDLAQGLARALTREAEEEARYAPSGGFTLQLPADYPLRTWGVHSLRVWVRSEGMWAAPQSDAGPWPAFYWKPGSPPSSWTLPAELAPLTAATMAALWRDLHIAGEEAVPRRKTAPRKVSATTPPPRRRSQTNAPRRRQNVRVLPTRSRRWFAISGSRRWGSDEERRIIRRRAHGVRGHLRRLPPAWRASDEAKEIARLFGVPIPDGYTFVRPHVRGGGLSEGVGVESPAPTPTVVQARGLAAIMALLSSNE